MLKLDYCSLLQAVSCNILYQTLRLSYMAINGPHPLNDSGQILTSLDYQYTVADTHQDAKRTSINTRLYTSTQVVEWTSPGCLNNRVTCVL